MLNLEDPNIASIWLKIYITPKKSILLVSAYRQWRLPNLLNQPESGSKREQIKRFEEFSEQIRKAKRINKNIILMWDSNVDSKDQQDRDDIRELKVKYNDLLEKII